MVEGFERDFAHFTDAAHCLGVSIGTDAVRFALMAAGVQRGDIVVTVPPHVYCNHRSHQPGGRAAGFRRASLMQMGESAELSRLDILIFCA